MPNNKRTKYKQREDGMTYCPKCEGWFEKDHFKIYPWNNTIKIKCKNQSKIEKDRFIINDRGFKVAKYRKEARNILQDNGSIYCFKCDDVFDASHFKIYKNSRDGKQNQYCCNTHDKRFTKNNKEKSEISNYYDNPILYRLDMELQNLYGITLDDYNKMLQEQNNCCAICKKSINEFKQRLFVDHNHYTGIVRGLLCNSCNRGIGFLKDSKEVINNALIYLEKYN